MSVKNLKEFPEILFRVSPDDENVIKESKIY